MPLVRARMGDPANPDTCRGFLSVKKRAGWRLEGPAAYLQRNDYAEPLELGYVLPLLEPLLVGGPALDQLSHAEVEFAPSTQFNAWLDVVCSEARVRLAASRGQVSRMQAALVEGAVAAAAGGHIPAATFALGRVDFALIEDLWIAALADDADPAAALLSRLPRFEAKLAPLHGAARTHWRSTRG